MSAKKKSPPKPKIPAPGPPPVKKAQSVPSEPGFFDRPGTNIFYLAIGVIALVAFFVYKDFLLFNKILLFKDIGSDSLNWDYPWLVMTARELHNLGSLTWSFNHGMGQNISPFAYFDPTNFILYIFPQSKIIWLIGYKEFFKVIISGMLLYGTLRSSGRGRYAAMIGGMMYAFCGYLIVGSTGWSLLSFDALNIALLLFSFELLYKKNILWLFPLPIYLMSLSNPFFLVLYGIFLTVYAVFRYIQDNNIGYKSLMVLFLKMVALGIVGLVISLPVLVDHVRAFLEGARVSGPNSFFDKLSSSPIFYFDALQFGTGINRFFCTEILGTGTNYKGFANMMEAPVFYCGIPCLLLTPLVFSYLPKKQRTLFGIVLGIWILPFIFPYFRYALWMFTGDYYRTYSVFVSIIFIVFATMALDKLLETKKVNLKVLIAATVGLLILQALPYFEDKHAIKNNLATAVRVLTLAYAGILFWITLQKNSQVPLIAFLVLFAIELASFSYLTVNRNANITAQEVSDRVGYNDYTVEATDYAKKNSTAFFRVDKNYVSSPAMHFSLNDGMVFDYNGTSCYNSFNQKYYLEYLRAYHIVKKESESDSRWPTGLISRPILESLNSVQYIFSKGGYTNGIWHLTTDSVAKFEDVLVLKNKFVAPFGYTYDKYIPFSKFDKLDDAQRDFFGLRAAVVNDEDLDKVKGMKEMNVKDTINPMLFSSNLFKRFRDSLSKDSLHVLSFSRDHLSGTINLSADKIIYLSIPYDVGWQVQVDGNAYKPLLLSAGMIGIVPGKGSHKIELEFIPPYHHEEKLAGMAGLLLWVGLGSFGLWRRRKKVGKTGN